MNKMNINIKNYKCRRRYKYKLVYRAFKFVCFMIILKGLDFLFALLFCLGFVLLLDLSHYFFNLLSRKHLLTKNDNLFINFFT